MDKEEAISLERLIGIAGAVEHWKRGPDSYCKNPREGKTSVTRKYFANNRGLSLEVSYLGIDYFYVSIYGSDDRSFQNYFLKAKRDDKEVARFEYNIGTYRPSGKIDRTGSIQVKKLFEKVYSKHKWRIFRNVIRFLKNDLTK